MGGKKRKWKIEFENVVDMEWLTEDIGEEQMDIIALPLDEVIESMKTCKRSFEEIPSSLFAKARQLTNKFEVLGKGRCFINRSAMKLANMDHFLHLIPSKPCRFADLCGGPGGFSDYLRWKMPSIIGWGITLDTSDESCRWKVSNNTNLNLEYGDLTQNETILKFAAKISPKGVDLVVGDGGFVQARDEEDQETMMHRLILCQMITMYHILQPGGTFVCKTFELSNEFSISLISLLTSTFQQVAIVKPVTSRPASSERYIVARNLRQRLSATQLQQLLQLNANWNSNKIVAAVTTTIPKTVYSKLKDIHHRLGTAQEAACRAILEYAMTKGNRAEPLDRNAYFDYWGV